MAITVKKVAGERPVYAVIASFNVSHNSKAIFFLLLLGVSVCPEYLTYCGERLVSGFGEGSDDMEGEYNSWDGCSN